MIGKPLLAGGQCDLFHGCVLCVHRRQGVRIHIRQMVAVYGGLLRKRQTGYGDHYACVRLQFLSFAVADLDIISKVICSQSHVCKVLSDIRDLLCIQLLNDQLSVLRENAFRSKGHAVTAIGSDGAALVLSSITVCLLFACILILRIFRQLCEAKNGRILCVIGDILHLVRRVAFNGLDPGRRFFFCCCVLCSNSYMFGLSVFIQIKKDQISRLRDICSRFPVNVKVLIALRLAGQHLNPCVTVRGLRHLLSGDLCIVQAEVYKHGTPVLIRLTVPCAITGVALDGLSILLYRIVLCTFHVIDLCFGDCQQILCPIPGQFYILKCLFPVRSALHLSLRIGSAGKHMGMFRLFADQLHFPALIRMSMNSFCLCLLLTADQDLHFLQAAFSMLMAGILTFLLLTDQFCLCLITFFLMNMTDSLALLQSADQRLLITFLLRVDMFLSSAVYRVLQRNCRKDQGICRAERNHQGKAADYRLPPSFFQINRRSPSDFSVFHLFHQPFLLLYIAIFSSRIQNPAGARCEVRSARSSAPVRHSLPRCSGNPPRCSGGLP